MSTTPDYMNKMSEALSEVMDDIGVNEKLVMERRRSYNLREALKRFIHPLWPFIFGSQIEGSTTLGLRSDMDILYKSDQVNVIQYLWEWKSRSSRSVMMIQNENISPGYCYLQFIRSDITFPAPADDIEIYGYNVIDSEGRLLFLNTWTIGNIPIHSEGRILWDNTINSLNKPDNGPAITRQIGPGHLDIDEVLGLCCDSSPHQAAPWLQKLTESTWPSEDDNKFCRNAGFFLVSACSKLSDMPKCEWRISTSLQERCLMFSLNITQLRCYVLMKMILQTHIHPYVEDVLSSFMCKNVLLYCVYNSSHESSQEWHTGNLLSYLHLCLFMLKERILQRNCPHLMIPGNNLLTGRMTDAQRGKLLDIIDNLMESKEELLYKIQVDDLGSRLKMKLNIIPSSPELLSATEIADAISGVMLIQTAGLQSNYVQLFLTEMYNEHLEVTQQNMSELLSNLEKNRDEGNLLTQSACDHLIPLVKSTLGSVMAGISIDAQEAISDEAFTYLEAGKESDVFSGRLRHVSVLYCTGDNERAEYELKNSQYLYNISMVYYLNCCFPRQPVSDKVGFLKACDDDNEEAIQFVPAFCARFLNKEINCVPHELRYEILKSYIEEDRKMRTEEDSWWMNYIAVDSVPYLYFLQYKTYGRLQRRTEQEEALFNLVRNVEIQPHLNHTETTLNLLGQCMEQENLQAEAFQYYIQSLQHRERNNAARFLMCIQLFKLWKKYNV